VKKSEKYMQFITDVQDRPKAEIESVTFGVYSTEEILKMSVVEINSSKLTNEKNSVYDERMGVLENNKLCLTCNKNSEDCVGHFGHIKLNEKIISPMFYKQVCDMLYYFCVKCNRLLLSQELIQLKGLSKIKLKKQLLERKVDECSHCGTLQPSYKLNINEGIINMISKDEDKKIVVEINPSEIKNIFDSVKDEDLEVLGVNKELSHPRNYIMEVFPVMPPCSRPYVIAGDGNICDDDLTNQLLEIVKCNNYLKKPEVIKSETKRTKVLQSLKFRISTFLNNSNGRAKHTTSGRPMKGIKERLTGKSGQIRSHLMGKRVNFSGRTVIGPDPTLKMGELAIPREVAENLTIPVRVNDMNISYLYKIVNSGKANYVIKNNGKTRINLKYALHSRQTKLNYGDIIVRAESKQEKVQTGREVLRVGDVIKRGDKIITDIKIAGNRKYDIKAGDIVERHLVDGDIVLLNRQPTLWSGSMLAKTVRVMKHKTFRFNLATTSGFNADFDGDEIDHVLSFKQGA